jgi:hypothetical protein
LFGGFIGDRRSAAGGVPNTLKSGVRSRIVSQVAANHTIKKLERFNFRKNNDIFLLTVTVV